MSREETPEAVTVDNSQVAGLGQVAGRAVRWVALEKWVTRFIGLGVFVVLGRLLVPTDFGVVAIASTIVTLLVLLSDQGFSGALVQRFELDRQHLSTCFWAGIALSLVFLSGLWLSAPAIAAAYGAPGLTSVIRALSFVIPIQALAGVPSAILQRTFNFKSLALRRISGTVAGSVGAVAAAAAGWGVWSLVVQAVGTSLVSLIVLWSVGDWRPDFAFSLTALRDIWSVGWHIVSIELVGYANSQADKFIIGAVAGAEALGYYFVGERIVAMIMDIQTSVVAQIALSTFSRLQQEKSKALQVFYKMTAASASISLPVYVVAACVAPYLIPSLFGPQWPQSIMIMQILCLMGALNSIIYFDRNFLVALGASSKALVLTAGQALLGVVVIVVAARFGIIAVAISMVLRQYAFWPIRLFILKRATGLSLRPYFGSLWRCVTCAAIALGVGWSVVLMLRGVDLGNWPRTLILTVTIFGVYGGILFLINRTFLAEMVRLVRGRS